MKSGNTEGDRGDLETGNQVAPVGGFFVLFFISSHQWHHHMKTGTNAMRFHDLTDWITAVATALTAIVATFVPFRVEKIRRNDDLIEALEEGGV